MLFSSVVFLCLFLPFVIGLYFIASNIFKNTILLVASLLFYTFGEPFYVLILIGISFCIYITALLLSPFSYKKSIYTFLRPCFFWGAIFLTLSILFYFKYWFFSGSVLFSMGFIDQPFAEIILPLGISFYTFQAISYLIDVYTRTVTAEKNFFRLLLYISFFPQLVAGPILKYHDIAPQLTKRTHSLVNVAAGFRRFVIGLGKKVLIANTLGQTVDQIFSLPTHELSMGITWIGAVFYMLQLYYDFSGYSDMAIGLGRVFGFKFPENFNYPYIARSITDFWHRWHISLSSWFKEYLYIPLGGNKRGFPRTLLNLAIVFFLTGLWHGAGWTFIVWGIWHGCFILCEKTLKHIDNTSFPVFFTPFKHLYALGVILIGWVIFRSDTLSQARDYLGIMFGLNKTTPDYGILYYVSEFQILVCTGAIIATTGIFKNISIQNTNTGCIKTALSNLGCLVILGACLIFLTATSFNPFIYFRF